MEEHKNFLDDLSREKPESFRDEVFISSKRKTKRILYMIPAILILVFLVFLVQKQQVSLIPDMTGWKLEEIQSWVQKNHKNTMITGVFSTESPVDTFLSQDIPKGKKIKESDTLIVNYSLGGDPNEAIAFVELKSMTVQEVKAWIDKNALTGVTMKYEKNEVVPKDTVINYELVDGTKDTFLRKNRVTVFVSIGNEDVEDIFEMPDFMGLTRGQASQLAEDNMINVTVKEEFNPYIEYGKVFQQNYKKDTKISRKDEVIVQISLGAPILVPDFSGLTRGEATELATLHSLTVFFKLQPSKETLDTVIGQDVLAGTEVDQKKIVTIFIAEEDSQIDMPDFVGLSSSEATNLASLEGIKAFMEGNKTSVPDSIVLSQSIAAGKAINKSDIITLKMGKEIDLITVPNFSGLTQAEATSLASLYEIKVFVKSSDILGKSGTVVTQSVKPGSRSDKSQIIVLELAKETNQITVPDFSGLSSAEASSLATLNNIKVFMKNKVSTEKSGTVISQTIEAGTQILQEKVITLYISTGQNKVPNFIGLSKNEATVAAQNLSIKLLFNEVETTNVMNNKVFEQSVAANKAIDLDKTILLSIAVNSGVVAKELGNVSRATAEAWASQNGITLNIIDQYSDTYPIGALYGQDCTDQLIPSRRIVTVYQSLGKISIGNYIGKTKLDILQWKNEVNSKGGLITLVFTSDYDSVQARGNITMQSIKSDLVDLDEIIYVWVSFLENGIKIPNLLNLEESEFKTWCSTNSVAYLISDSYSDIYKAGRMFGQNYINVSVPYGETLKIYRSLGRVKLTNFIDQPKASVVAWMNQVNSFNAAINIIFKEDYSDTITEGKIIDQSLPEGEINFNATITVTVSLGVKK